MSIALGLLGLGRRFHQNTLQANVTIQRKTGTARNADTGAVTPTWVTIYTGPAELVLADEQARDLDVAGQRLAEQTPTLKLPIAGPNAAAAAAVLVDDVGEITANPADEHQVGQRFRVDGVHGKTLATARRFPVEILSHA